MTFILDYSKLESIILYN